MELIATNDPDIKLDLQIMDEAHYEFIDQLNQLADASGHDFDHKFLALVEHVTNHFADEKALMEASGFPAITEHVDEHQRILGELNQLKRKVTKGAKKLARAYIKERLPEWFHLHLATMDSALAAHTKLGTD